MPIFMSQRTPILSRLRLLATVSIFMVGLIGYPFWPFGSTEAKTSAKEPVVLRYASDEKNVPATDEIPLAEQTLAASTTQNSSAGAEGQTAQTTQPLQAAPDKAPAPAVPDPPAPSLAEPPGPAVGKTTSSGQPPVTKVALNISSPSIQAAEQAQNAISSLSQTFNNTLWAPPVEQNTYYAADTFSPRATRALTLAAFLLIISGIAVRRSFAQQQKRRISAGTLAGQQNLSFVR